MSKPAMPSNDQKGLLSYNGEIFVFQLGKEKVSTKKGTTEISKLDVQRMELSKKIRVFYPVATGVYLLNENESNFKIICCHSVLDTRTGLYVPCVLIQSESNSTYNYNLLMLFLSKSEVKLRSRLKFTRGYELKDSLRILNGPLILWKYHNMITYISPQTGTVTSLPVYFISLVWAGTVDGLGVVLLGCLQELAKSGLTTEKAHLGVYSFERLEMLADTYVIPRAYGRTVTEVCVYAAEFVNNQLKMSLVALTRKNQLISFQNGAINKVCQLPFEGSCTVQLLNINIEDSLFIVSSESNDVCAVWKKSFEVAAKWSKIISFYIDDYFGAGTEQLLILLETPLNTNSLSLFLITDLIKINFSSDTLGFDEDILLRDSQDEPSESWAVPGLKRRLHSGLSNAKDLEKELSIKKEVISRSSSAFINLVEGSTGSTSSANEESSVPPCGEKEKSTSISVEKLPRNFQDSDYRVEKLWYRVLDANLVVSVKISSPQQLSLNNMTLSLLLDPSHDSKFILKCQNRVIKLRTDPAISAMSIFSEISSKEKRFKLTHNSKEYKSHAFQYSFKREYLQTVTAITSIPPLLALKNFYCFLILQIQQRKNDHSFVDHYVPCGRFHINLEDTSRRKNLDTFLKTSPKENQEDILGLLASLYRCCFQVTSSTCTLTSVKTWLVEHLKCELTKQFPDIWYCKRSDFYGTLFQWKDRTPTKGILIVYCRNQTVLLQCLHYLMKVLPTNFFLKNIKSEKEDILTKHVALDLGNELCCLTSSLSSALSEAENNSPPDSSGSTDKSVDNMASFSERKGAVLQYRKEVHREKVQMTSNLKVSGSVYRKITLKVAREQLKSDITIKKLDKSQL
ncbi:Fanconi anemia group B protein [Echinops telfairi]|uniref:Fanconi anemia group B protein n=1 Tax=Echinops telfairi TaxID=9371 RepID=A0AC55D4M2_ECHTE|nr:Fanconi anemia group B protein [Echinops telfairi]